MEGIILPLEMTRAALRVARIGLKTFKIPFVQPFATARGKVEVREGALVRIETADGAHGWSEASLCHTKPVVWTLSRRR